MIFTKQKNYRQNPDETSEEFTARERQEKAMNNNVPDCFANAKLSDSPDIQRIAAEENSLYVHGGIGVGKTHAICALAMEQSRKFVKVLFIPAFDIFSKLRSAYDGIGYYEDSIMSEITHPTILIIDDLGKEKPSEWTLAKLFQIIELRQQQGKITHITSNYSPKELYKKFATVDKICAEAILSRIQGDSKIIELTGKDRRLEK